jgi:hypothetical protein
MRQISGQASLSFRRLATSTPAAISIDFFQQRFGRQHHAVADVAGHVVAQDAGRNQVQHRLLARHDQGVAGIVAALEAHHALRAVGQPVDDLALAFITPLGADHHDVFCCHGEAP